MDNTRKKKTAVKCSFVDYLNDEYHRNCKEEINHFLDFSDQDQVIHKWRAGLILSDMSIKTICHYHKYKFGGFKKQFTKCCNAFDKHKKKVKGGHLLTLEIASKLQSDGFNVVPG